MTKFNKNDADKWYLRNEMQLLSANEDVISQTLNTIFSKYVKRGSNILEIGCGDGIRINQLTELLACKGFGVDLSPCAIASGKTKYPNVTLLEADANSLPFESQKFDAVYLGFFLYLIDRNNYLRVLSEADRVLNDGGYLGILDFDVPNYYSNTYAPNPELKSFKMDNSKVFTSSGLYTLVEKSSFQHSSHNFASNLDERISLQILRKETLFQGKYND